MLLGYFPIVSEGAFRLNGATKSKAWDLNNSLGGFMQQINKLVGGAVLLALMQSAAFAEGTAVTAKVGTLGLGADIAVQTPHEGVVGRLGFNAFNYSFNGMRNTVNYNAKLQLQTVTALADWYPSSDAGFRVSGGLVYNNNKASFAGTPTGGTYTLGGVVYNATQIGGVNGTTTFNSVAPYLGIGFGNPVASGKGWGVTSDIGILFQGSPKTTLTATCGVGVAPAVCAQVQASTAAEQTKLNDSLKNFRYYPVASIGVSYQW